MSKYRITIEGKTYDVEIVPLDEQSSSEETDKYKGYKNSGADPVVRIINSSAEKKTVMEYGMVRAPIPGTIISVNVSDGDSVHKGQIILLLEAMKMNNEICSPADGVIRKIHVSKGSVVQSNDILFEIVE